MDSLADEPAEALEELLKAASAQIADIAGTWKIRAGAPSMPVLAITDRDVLVNKEATLDPFPSLDQTYNGITASYPDPDAVWQSKDAPARYNAEWEAADRFGRKVADIQLPAVPYPAQVQRLMRAWIEAERRFRTHKFTLPPAAAALEPLDCIAWSSIKNGYALKQFEISETVDDLMTCVQGQSLKEVDPADYDWTGSMVLPSTPSVPGYTRPADAVLAGWAVNAATVKDAGGEVRQVALALSWDPDTIASGIEWEIRRAGTMEAQPGSTLAVAAGGIRVSEGILAVTTYEARGRPVEGDVWTDWASATTDPLSLGLGDLSEDLREFLESMQAWMDEGLGDLPGEMLALAERLAGEEAARVADAQLSAVRWRETRETVRSLQAQAIDLAAADHAARDQIRRSMAVELGTLRARYDEQIVTLADVGRAAALRIETLEVTSADQTARIQQVAQAQIEGDEALAQLITGLAVGNATQFDAARIWYFDTSAEGWTGAPAAPAVISGGFLRPGAGAGGYIVSPAGLGIGGGTYAQVRLRLMRSGAPAWTGWLWWAAEGESWDSARRVAVWSMARPAHPRSAHSPPV